MSAPLRVLVLCTGNSARSQMAEALLATRGGASVVAASAGTRPAPRVNPYAVEALAEIGIAWDGGVPKDIDAVIGQPWDVVFTVCDNAKEACPVFPGRAVMVHWGIPDPADEVEPARARAAFRAARDLLAARIARMLALPEAARRGEDGGAGLRQIAVELPAATAH